MPFFASHASCRETPLKETVFHPSAAIGRVYVGRHRNPEVWRIRPLARLRKSGNSWRALPIGATGENRRPRLGKDSQVSASVPDWSREAIRKFWDPGPKLLRAIRRYQTARAKSGVLAAMGAKYWVLNHWFWSQVTQSEIHLHSQIAGGLRLPHPTGIILHPESVIGPNCMIFHQVTLSGPVTLGGHVDIGAGAKILGPLQIGDHVKIGANAVVTGDVPDCATMVGIPARQVGRNT